MIQRLLGSPMISLSDFDDQGEYDRVTVEASIDDRL